MNPRIKQFVSSFSHYKLDAYLVTRGVNITYLTGFESSDSWLLVFPRKIFYITDARYTFEARSALKGVVVRQYNKSLLATFYQLIASPQRARNIGFDERYVSVALYKQLKKYCPKGVKLVPKNGCIEQLREIKRKEEIQQIRKCIDLNLRAFKYLKSIINPGMTEKNVLMRLERYVRAKGAFFSFPPIIASGPNSCFPHAQITARIIKNMEPVLVDMGIDLNGYKSDLTRMFFLGKIPPHIQEVFEKVKAAQQHAISQIRAGIPANKVDQEARNCLKKNKLDKFFSHSLGHGIGLEVHEAPRLSKQNSEPLKSGMIVTVEPGVYIPNKFGIRIEDMVLVKEDGCEILSRI